jgi:hypothetical protein
MKAKEKRVCQHKDQAEASKATLGQGLASAIEVNGQKLREHFGEFVRDTVEQTLNTFLEAESGSGGYPSGALSPAARYGGGASGAAGAEVAQAAV